MKQLRSVTDLLRPALLMIIAINALAYVSLGQVQGSIEGTVKDSKGDAVAGANVKLTGEGPTPVLRNVVTDDGGAFRFQNLPLGKYLIEVGAGGFKKSSRSIDVINGATAIEVVTLETSTLSTVLSGQLPPTIEEQTGLSAYPNFNNDYSILLQNTVGAVVAGVGSLGKILLDGKGLDSTTIRFDGMDASPQIDLPTTDKLIDFTGIFLKPVVAVDAENPDTKTWSKAFEAQSGYGAGVIIDNKTYPWSKRDKEHTDSNSWRSEISTEYVNDTFNARNYFDYFGKNGVRRTRVGGKLGGPLDNEDKLKIFIAFEAFNGRTDKNIFEAIPKEARCNCGVTGSVSPWLNAYIPSGTTGVPSALSSPDFEIVQRRGRTAVDANMANIRFDGILTKTSNILVRYTPQFGTVIVPDGVTGRQQKQRLFFNNFLVSYFSQNIASTYFATVKFGINHTGVKVSSENPVGLPAGLEQSVINLSGSVTPTGLPGIQSVGVATLGSLIKGIGRGFEFDPKTYVVGYDAKYILTSQHTLAFGVEGRFVKMEYDRLGGVTYSFSNLLAFRNSTPTTTNYLSDLGGPSPFSDTVGPRHLRQNNFHSFVQLTSQLLKDGGLALTYGLRYDYFGSVKEQNNRIFLLDPVSGVQLPQISNLFDPEVNNFQPRFGLSFKPAGRNMELLGGIGVYLGAPKVSDLLLPIESDRLNTTITGGNFSTTMSSILQDFKQQTQTRQFQPLAFSRDFRIPEQLIKWEMSIKRTFSGKYDLKGEYTGNTGRRLPVGLVANRIISVSTNPDPTKPALIRRAFDVTSSGPQPYGEFYYRASKGRGSYNAFSASFKRNGKNQGVYFQTFSLQYTYALNRGNGSGIVASDPQNLDADYGYNAGDVRHSFTASATYKLWAKETEKSHMLKGWRIIPNLNIKSGSPLIVKLDRPDVVYLDGAGALFSTPAIGRTAVQNIPGGGSAAGSQVPNLLPNVNPLAFNDGLNYLNAAAFTVPQPGTFGNLSRGALRGHGSMTLDIALSRYIVLKNWAVGEFKIDAYNVFNKVNFSNPTVLLPATNLQNNQLQPGTPFTASTAGSAFGIINAADLGRRIVFSFTLRMKKTESTNLYTK